VPALAAAGHVAQPGWCPVQTYETVYRCCDPLGNYPVVLCPRCGASVPVNAAARIGDTRAVPGHRLRPPTATP
jgi:hypothetical protein